MTPLGPLKEKTKLPGNVITWSVQLRGQSILASTFAEILTKMEDG